MGTCDVSVAPHNSIIDLDARSIPRAPLHIAVLFIDSVPSSRSLAKNALIVLHPPSTADKAPGIALLK